jgi:pimeloyl-[acyl-carrier protein] methyl ester esterase
VTETYERFSARGIHYRVHGKGRPVICLHGWCLCSRLWLYLDEALAPDHLVVCPDLAGFGRSAHLAGPYTLRRLATDIAELLDELALEAPIVVAFAFGACVAMELAASRPRQLAGLVLIGVPSGSTAPYDRMPRAMRRDWPEFARRSAQAICKQPQSEATLAYLEDMFVGTPLPVALETVGVLERFEPDELAPKVRLPTLLIHGRNDDVVPVSVAATLAAAMPSARLEVVDDSGHLVPFDQTSAVTTLVQEFAKC